MVRDPAYQLDKTHSLHSRVPFSDFFDSVLYGLGGNSRVVARKAAMRDAELELEQAVSDAAQTAQRAAISNARTVHGPRDGDGYTWAREGDRDPGNELEEHGDDKLEAHENEDAEQMERALREVLDLTAECESDIVYAVRVAPCEDILAHAIKHASASADDPSYCSHQERAASILFDCTYDTHTVLLVCRLHVYAEELAPNRARCTWHKVRLQHIIGICSRSVYTSILEGL